MGMQFRVLYHNPNPVPATKWEDVEHGDTVFPAAKVLAIQFRDDDTPIDENDPRYTITLMFNDAVDLMTDADGRYVQPTDQQIADSIGVDVADVIAAKEGL